jgi:endogenous inhibitor of DNA gyrase (YacG/DUF329 family)
MGEAVTFKPRRPCPICSKPSQPKFHPFCSNRCAQIDLNRWLGGHYAVPTEDEGQSSSDDDTKD